MKILFILLLLSSCSAIQNGIKTAKFRKEIVLAHEYNLSLAKLQESLIKYTSSWHDTVPGYEETGRRFERQISFNGYIYKGKRGSGKGDDALPEILSGSFKDLFKAEYSFYKLEETKNEIVMLNNGILFHLKKIAPNKSSMHIYPLVKFKQPSYSADARPVKKNGLSFSSDISKENDIPDGPVNIDKLKSLATRSHRHEYLHIRGIEKNAAKKIDAAVEEKLAKLQR